MRAGGGGEPFLVRAISCLLDLVLSGTHVRRLSSRAPRERDCAKHAHAKRALALQLVLTSHGAPSDGATSSAGFSETRRVATQLKAGTD